MGYILSTVVVVAEKPKAFPTQEKEQTYII